MYVIEYFISLLKFEIINMLNRNIKICENCKQFFIPKNTIDAIYCDRKIGDNIKYVVKLVLVESVIKKQKKIL